MAILDLLKQINRKQHDQPHPVLGKESAVRNSFLTGLAMQAHADNRLTVEETSLFYEVARAFQIEKDAADALLAEAREPDEHVLEDIRNNLIHDKHKYYFIIDLYIMAHQDNKVAAVETQVIEQFARLLDVDQEELDFLTDLADAVLSNDPRERDLWIQNFVKRLPGGENLHIQDFDHYAPEG